MTDLWDALSAVGTCAATVAAVAIATFDSRRNRRKESEQRLEDTDREKEKARTVIAEVDHDLTKAHVSNFGASPILNLEVLGAQITITRESGDQEFHYRPRCERGQYGWQVVGPGQRVTAKIDLEQGLVHVTPGPEIYDLMIDVVFTDADGRIWKRLGDNQPERVTDVARQVPRADTYRSRNRPH
ncbi:hypothetical protein [Streptomyces chartreusis]|uniref:hypothetical protein n=1 Tax=Streptomyces chartreusis TaxID=1969 RepID=UPI0036602C93